jgi:hypothetical protein
MLLLRVRRCLSITQQFVIPSKIGGTSSDNLF